MSFSHFFENTQEDIEYVLNNTTQQYQSHMQFIEDGGAIAIRHNSLLDSFFNVIIMIQKKLKNN